MVAGARLEVGLQAFDQAVVLVAHRGVGVLEDGLRAGGHRFVGEVQRGRVLVHGNRSARPVTGVDPEQLTVGDGHRQHDVGEQRVDHDHVVERIPLLFGDFVQRQDRVEREDQPVVRSERVENRAVAAGEGGEGLPVHGGEMVVLREGVDRELPIDRDGRAPSRPAATTARCPRNRARRPGDRGVRRRPSWPQDPMRPKGIRRTRRPGVRSDRRP